MWGRIVLALLLALGLGFTYYYFDVIKARERDTAERIADKAIGITAGIVTSIEIDRGDGILSIKKVDGDWKILKPISVDADNEAVELLLTAAEYMTTSGEVGETEKLSRKDYGLDNPMKITFGLEDGGSRGLIVGYKNPVGTDHYAIGKDVGKIVLVNQGRVAAITKNLFELRDKDIFPVRAEDVTEVMMRLAEHLIHAKKDEAGQWHLMEPIAAKADKKQIENIVDNLAALTFSGFLDEEGKELSKYGLDSPFAALTLVYGGSNKTTTLLLGTATGGGGFYAKVKDKKVVGRIPSGIMQSFPATIDDLRDRRLVHLLMDAIEKIEIDNNGEVLSLEISGESSADDIDDKKWLIVKPTPGRTDAEGVLGLLFDLERAKATRFVNENRHSQAELGLDKPDVIITVTAKTGVNVIKLSRKDDGKGKRYFAQVDKGNTIYEVDYDTYQGLARGYRDLRYKKVFNIKSQEVGRILIDRVGEIFEVTRSQDNYNLLKPEKRRIKNDFYNRFVWTILSLKHDDPLETADKGGMGFDKPALTISVYNTKGDFVDKVTVGVRADGGKQFYMKSEKRDAIYLIGELFVTERVVKALEGLMGK